ncbi:polysaccharide ABC transporter ATP-binding protein [Parabacteroides sp. FAFU027]|uniref:ABC transporter ATP-binding protein n=1 Tax=Parabacteroides sp. FAFU027 TaxID=2922715 RepID=UPI001FAE895F|nr:ABC transporter ATP-binding protein [Parabacteroides sp. FAFU027]
MSKTVIKIENLSKLYSLGEVGTGTIAHDLNRWYARLRGKEDPYAKVGVVNDRTQKAGDHEEVWALRNISLEVKQGDVLGIIGRNGAGKSTLLKILSRITTPTTGKYSIKGRMASLLEVGTGFHGDMTGRENIYMNGTIMGMRRWEIDKKLDEIVDFSGVAKYLDTPVKRYSSGMTVRLGFAIAAHLEPEILIVDEVLAVGDAEFQEKAIGKMQDVSHNDGRTVLFVSHNMSSMRSLCTNGIILKQGVVEYSGIIAEAISHYENVMTNDESYWVNDHIENFPAKLTRLEIRDENGNLRNDFKSSENVNVLFFVTSYNDEIKNVKVGFDLIRRGETVFRSQQVDSLSFDRLKANQQYVFTCQIPKWMLNEGEYIINPSFNIHCVQSLISNVEGALKLKVKIDPSNSHYHQLLNEQNHPGLFFPILNWNVDK